MVYNEAMAVNVLKGPLEMGNWYRLPSCSTILIFIFLSGVYGTLFRDGHPLAEALSPGEIFCDVLC
jgi:hypothetical protein